MVETRDEETGEIIKQLVDKVRRHKITRLKKTILSARKSLKKTTSTGPQKPARGEETKADDSGFETVESGDESSNQSDHSEQD